MCFSVVTSYARRRHLDLYRAYRNPFYSLTVEFDVTRLKRFVAEHGYRTYLNLCYGFTRGAQAVEELRHRLRDGRLVLYERLHPGLTVPAADGTFGFAHLRWHDDVHEFNRRAEATLPAPDQPPDLTPAEHDNYVFFTAIPGVSFSAFSHAWGERTEGAPRVAFGKLIEDGGRTTVAAGLQVNHCFVDGRAIGRLVPRVQAAFDDLEGST